MSHFTITHMQSGPEDLSTQLPRTGSTVRLFAGDTYYATLDEPVYFRPDDAFPLDRCEPDLLGHDDHGPYLWITDVVVHPHTPGQRPHRGMTDFPMALSYVLDPTAAADDTLDTTKTAVVAVVLIDDAPTAGRPTDQDPDPAADTPLQQPQPAAPEQQAAGAMRAPEQLQADPEPTVPLQQQIDHIKAQLMTIAGAPLPLDSATPAHVRPDTEDHHDGPCYSIATVDPADTRYRYRTRTFLHGTVTRETTAVDELLYWIADDLARTTAWGRASASPAAATMTEAERMRLIAIPLWHSYMFAIRKDWGYQTSQATAEATRDKQPIPHAV
jgi:hypothetical protein